MAKEIRTEKKPGHLVLSQRGELFIVDRQGKQRPYEQPHRREQRERAEEWRSRNQAVAICREPRRFHPLLAFFRGA